MENVNLNCLFLLFQLVQLTTVENCSSLEDFIIYCAEEVNDCSVSFVLDVHTGIACYGPTDSTENHVNIALT